MEPRIVTIPEKKCIGKRVVMSFSDNKTGELFQSFMPRRKEIQNAIGSELYCIQVYDNMDFNTTDLNNQFEKWAAVEVSDFNSVPGEMETITVPDGLYAVFLYKGAASAAQKTFQYIYGT